MNVPYTPDCTYSKGVQLVLENKSELREAGISVVVEPRYSGDKQSRKLEPSWFEVIFTFKPMKHVTLKECKEIIHKLLLTESVKEEIARRVRKSGMTNIRICTRKRTNSEESTYTWRIEQCKRTRNPKKHISSLQHH